MIAAMRGNITKPTCQFRRLSTGNQIARRDGNLGYSFVNKSLLNAGSAFVVVRSSPPTCSIASAKRVQRTSDNTPPATKSP